MSNADGFAEFATQEGSVAAEMAAFDALPSALRRALDMHPLPLSALAVADHLALRPGLPIWLVEARVERLLAELGALAARGSGVVRP